MARRLTALLYDAVIVLAFAGLGRRTHDGELSAMGTLETAWPFLTGALVGHLLVALLNSAREALPASLPSGAVVWVWTIAVALVLRRVNGHTNDPAFVLVATTVLGALMLGWRLIARRLR